jgi:hypothetical protein
MARCRRAKIRGLQGIAMDVSNPIDPGFLAFVPYIGDLTSQCRGWWKLDGCSAFEDSKINELSCMD